jgi:hypothetical protein
LVHAQHILCLFTMILSIQTCSCSLLEPPTSGRLRQTRRTGYRVCHQIPNFRSKLWPNGLWPWLQYFNFETFKFIKATQSLELLAGSELSYVNKSGQTFILALGHGYPIVWYLMSYCQFPAACHWQVRPEAETIPRRLAQLQYVLCIYRGEIWWCYRKSRYSPHAHPVGVLHICPVTIVEHFSESEPVQSRRQHRTTPAVVKQLQGPFLVREDNLRSSNTSFRRIQMDFMKSLSLLVLLKGMC